MMFVPLPTHNITFGSMLCFLSGPFWRFGDEDFQNATFKIGGIQRLKLVTTKYMIEKAIPGLLHSTFLRKTWQRLPDHNDDDDDYAIGDMLCMVLSLVLLMFTWVTELWAPIIQI